MKKYLIICIVLISFVLNDVLAEPGVLDRKARYCSKMQVREIMKALCGRPNRFAQKRSFFHTQHETFGQKERYLLWRRIFNIGENTTVTIPEASFQLSLLFGGCHDFNKENDLKNLQDFYQDLDNQKSQYNGGGRRGYPNYDASNEAPLLRYRREFTDECCDQPCKERQLLQYCPPTDEISR